MFGFLKERRREHLRARPFPDEWERVLGRNVAHYRALSPPDASEIRGHVRVLVAEKNFEGCAGLALTDEIRVTIAGEAANLLLHRDGDYFPNVDTVLVYPNAYLVPATTRSVGGVATVDVSEERGRMMPRQGILIVDWQSALAGARGADRGQSVVLHEFAHSIDLADGYGDGVPGLGGAQYDRWSRVFTAEFQRLEGEVARGVTPAVLRAYGATNPAEFFAVATEAFFGRPTELRTAHPALYDLLHAFYQQDLPRAHEDGRALES